MTKLFFLLSAGCFLAALLSNIEARDFITMGGTHRTYEFRIGKHELWWMVKPKPYLAYAWIEVRDGGGLTHHSTDLIWKRDWR